MVSTKRIFLLFLINLYFVSCDKNYETPLGEQLEIKFTEYVNNFTRFLEDFNDENLGKSEVGRFLRYGDIKPKLEGGRDAKSMKKMSMAMLPLIFHIGATSTWMLLTSLMAAKSVAIGIALLVFKIAVSSAKVASFFTTMKASKHPSPHHDWNWSPPEYGHDRSLRNKHNKPSEEWQTYSPEWTPNDASPQEYKAIPIYKTVDSDATPYVTPNTRNIKQFRRK